MAKCKDCKKEVHWLSLRDGWYCDDCAQARRVTAVSEAEARDLSERIILTTETAHNLPVDRRLDVITAEVVIGMNLFKDVASAFRDTFGGRSKAMQDGLRQARVAALSELRREACALGAHAVVGVDLDYSEISGGGKSMLFLVASGTAVTLKQDQVPPLTVALGA